ncbi:MAG: hypothetical protein WDN04_28180 [Rhodospirillales bacterium]
MAHLAQYPEAGLRPGIGAAGPAAQIKDRGNLLFNQVSQEVRLASPKGGLIDYVIGGYFLKAVDNESYDRAFAPAATPNTVTVRGRNDRHRRRTTWRCSAKATSTSPTISADRRPARDPRRPELHHRPHLVLPRPRSPASVPTSAPRAPRTITITVTVSACNMT